MILYREQLRLAHLARDDTRPAHFVRQTEPSGQAIFSPDLFVHRAELFSPLAVSGTRTTREHNTQGSSCSVLMFPNPITSPPHLASRAPRRWPPPPRSYPSLLFASRRSHSIVASRPLQLGVGHLAVFTEGSIGTGERREEEERSRVKMADFRTSTHRERWIFQPHDLMDRWAAANQRASKTLAQYGTTRLKVDPVDGSLSYPEPAPDHVEGSLDVKPLSCEEEQLMRVFYEQKIQEVCAAFKFPHKIQATAIIYFKRFYLQRSVMEHHPKHIMLTCVYSSCKVEENHVSAEELGKGIQQDHQIILNNEMIVLKSLDFDLIVYAPYRSIEGFIDDMEDFCRAGNGAHQRLKDLRQTAIYQVDKMMLTDAPLLYTPGQLALAALHKSNDVHRVLNFERYLESVFSRQHSDCPVEQFVQSIHTINCLVDQLKIPTLKDMRHIDRKLKHCLDPSSQDEHKKKEKKSKHKSKRTANDAQLNS